LGNGQKLGSCYGFGASQTKAIQLLENQDGNGFEFRNKTRLSAHHLPLLCFSIKTSLYANHASFYGIPAVVPNFGDNYSYWCRLCI
jgi:hypothetical protein